MLNKANVLTAVFISLLFLLCMIVAAPASYAAERADWHTITTENFYIHYAGGYESIAKSAAGIAEKVRPVVNARVGYVPKDKIHVVIADISDNFNAMAITGANIKIVLICSVPTDAYFLGTADDWLELVFTHEYVHAVQQDMANGPYAVIKSLFGRIPGLSQPNGFMPPAFIEGLAVYNETALGEGRGVTSAYDMFLRAEALDGRLPAIDEMLGFYDLDRWVPGGHAYLYGYSLHDYLACTYGDGVIRQINYEMSRIGFNGGLGAATHRATGHSSDIIYKGWKKWLTDRYILQKSDIESRGLTVYSLLGSAGWNAGRSVYSPDGKQLAYAVSGGDVGTSIRIRDLRSGNETALCDGAFGNFCWTPDGRHIIYSSYAVSGGKIVTDLFAAEAGTGRIIRLTRGAGAQSPSITRDGRRIAYIEIDGKTMAGHIVAAELCTDAKGKLAVRNPVRWLTNDSGAFASSVDWDLSGAAMTIELCDGKGKTGIYLLKEPGGRLQTIAEGCEYYTSPRFSADGRYIVYGSDRTGVHNIYAWDTVSALTKQVTNLLGGGFYPTTSPDGRFLTFSVYGSQGYSLASIPFEPGLWRVPEPIFTGQHWNRAAWKAKIDYEREPLAPVDTSKLIALDYSPITSFLPSWWLPLFDYGKGHFVLGGTTGMTDAKLNHTYFVTSGYDFITKTPGTSLEYQYIQYPFTDMYGGGGLTFDLSAVWEPASFGTAGGSTGLSLVVGHNSSRGAIGGNHGTSRIYGSFDTLKNVAAGYAAATTKGAGRLVRNLNYGTSVNSTIADGAPTAVSAYIDGEMRYRRGGALTGGIGLGAANTGQSLAGGTGALTLRGITAGEGFLAASSTLAARVTLGCEQTLVKINRGIGMWPLFFGSVKLHPFAEAGIIAGDSRINRAISAGAEISINLELQYGSANITPYLGVCVVESSRILRPETRFYLGFR